MENEEGKKIVSKKLIIIILSVVAIILLTAFIWMVLVSSKNNQENEIIEKNVPKVSKPKAEEPTTKVPPVVKQPDSASTIDAPVKINTTTGNQYFYYGAPAGQNNATPKKVFITLHGTEGNAVTDYGIWKPLVKDTGFALASLNWWDGSGSATNDYTAPEAINSQIHEFLTTQGYTNSDIVVLEGFSRGSANSFSVIAHDRAGSSPMIDVAVSSSGGVQDTYYNLTTTSIATKAKSSTIFNGVSWITSCGGKDKSAERDGCAPMQQASTFVAGKGATVLGNLSDPNGGHGALTTSSLNLSKQMFELIDAKF